MLVHIYVCVRERVFRGNTHRDKIGDERSVGKARSEKKVNLSKEANGGNCVYLKLFPRVFES